MLRKILYTFIAASFLMSAFSEAKVDTHPRAQKGEQHQVSTQLSPEDCRSCESEDCHPGAGHCLHHCHGLHYLAPFSQQEDFQLSRSKQGKTLISPNHNYAEPFLDPSLKPPLSLS